MVKEALNVNGVGFRLRLVRAEYGKTQKEMSFHMGLGETTWQNYERDKFQPPSDVLIRLAKDGYSVNWILLGIGEMLSASSTSALLVAETKATFAAVEARIIKKRLIEETTDALLDFRPNEKLSLIAGEAYRLMEQAFDMSGGVYQKAINIIQDSLHKEEELA